MGLGVSSTVGIGESVASCGDSVGGMPGIDGAGVAPTGVGGGVSGAEVGAATSTGLGVSSATGAVVARKGDGVATGSAVGFGVAMIAGVGVGRVA